MVTQAQTNP